MIRDVLREALERPYGLALWLVEAFVLLACLVVLGLFLLVASE